MYCVTFFGSVIFFVILFFNYKKKKVVQLVGGGSVINGATLSTLFYINLFSFFHIDLKYQKVQ